MLFLSLVVVTAAHCVENGFPDALHIGPTTIDRDTDTTNGQTISVCGGSIHPNYQFPYNDIAVMKLCSQSGNALAILNSDGNIPVSGATNLMVMGMGAESQSNGNVFGTQLKGALGDYINDCASRDSTYQADSNLCVTETDAVGACQGDSGGPLVINQDSNIVVGLVSYGELACEGNTLGGYVNIKKSNQK